MSRSACLHCSLHHCLSICHSLVCFCFRFKLATHVTVALQYLSHFCYSCHHPSTLLLLSPFSPFTLYTPQLNVPILQCAGAGHLASAGGGACGPAEAGVLAMPAVNFAPHLPAPRTKNCGSDADSAHWAKVRFRAALNSCHALAFLFFSCVCIGLTASQ